MRWLPFIAIFLHAYAEASISIQITYVLGALLILVLVISASAIGTSLIRDRGFKNFVLVQ